MYVLICIAGEGGREREREREREKEIVSVSVRRAWPKSLPISFEGYLGTSGIWYLCRPLQSRLGTFYHHTWVLCPSGDQVGVVSRRLPPYNSHKKRAHRSFMGGVWKLPTSKLPTYK